VIINTHQCGGNAEIVKEQSGATGVFATHQTSVGECLDGARRNIAHIAERRGHENEIAHCGAALFVLSRTSILLPT